MLPVMVKMMTMAASAASPRAVLHPGVMVHRGHPQCWDSALSSGWADAVVLLREGGPRGPEELAEAREMFGLENPPEGKRSAGMNPEICGQDRKRPYMYDHNARE